MDLQTPVSLGTTIVGTTYDGGVILAADTRRSAGTYITNRVSDKLTLIAENICVAQSGAAAHSELLIDHVSAMLDSHQLELKEQVSVKSAASLLHQFMYRNKDYLRVGIIVGGFDSADGASLYESTLGGTLLKTSYALGGSGSTYIYGWFDKYWRENMSAVDAREFVLRAVSHGMARDSASGGCIRIVMINKQGARREFIPADKVPPTYGEIAW